MKLQTAYVISIAWMIRTYKHHTNPYSVERSKDHLRYCFYLQGDAVPFFTLHVMRDEGLIKEFVRFDGKLKLHRVGHPAILLSDVTVKNGTAPGAYTNTSTERCRRSVCSLIRIQSLFCGIKTCQTNLEQRKRLHLITYA